MDKKEKNSRKMTPKQLAALIGVALLVLLYVVTLVVAIAAPPASGNLFQLCFFATLAVPLFIWIYIWMYGRLTGRHTIADMSAGTECDPHSAADTDPSYPAEDNTALGTAEDAADASPTDTAVRQDSPR